MAGINQNPTELVNETLYDGSGERGNGWVGYSMFRLLVPASVVPEIIGFKGNNIRKICEETKARIHVLNGPRERQRAVIVSAKEEPNAPLPPAIDGLLRVHKFVLDKLVNSSSKLLVPRSQLESLFGKQSTTMNSIKEESNCTVRILEAAMIHCALEDDVIVEVEGEPAGKQKGIELIASHLRKFLIFSGMVHTIEERMQMLILPYPQRMISYPHTIPPMPVQPRNPKVTNYVDIPLLLADAVLGAQCGNMSYVRGLTGATVNVMWPHLVTLELNGTAEQVLSAQQLIQVSLVSEAAAVSNPTRSRQ